MHDRTILVIAGLPGSGKSTLAEALATRLRIPLFSVDPIESAILQSGIERSFATGLAAYLVAETLAAEHLKRGTAVIIDAVSPVPEARAMWQRLSATYNAHLMIIECILDPQIHRQRIEARTRNLPGIPEVTWEEVEQRRRDYQPWQEDHLIVDTADSLASTVDAALRYIHARELAER